MSYSPLAIKRKYVLGEIYEQCDPIESIPVYMNDQAGELLGYVDQSMGHYADAFTFNLPEPICKQLSASHFDFAFDFEYAERASGAVSKKRIKLNHILLVAKKPLFNKKVVAEKAVQAKN